MAFSFASGASSASSGAALGTAFAPGIGTAIGALAGGLFGGFLGGGAEEDQKRARLANLEAGGIQVAKQLGLARENRRRISNQAKRARASAEVSAAASGVDLGSTALNATNASLFQAGSRVSFLDTLSDLNVATSRKANEANVFTKSANEGIADLNTFNSLLGAASKFDFASML